jgi:hypothetical protein
MAFSDVQPDWKITDQADLDFKTLRVTYRSTRHFTCLRSDPSNDTPTRARQAGIFPSVGDADPDDINMFCRSAEIKEFGLTALECTANYESLAQDPTSGNQAQQILQGWDFEFDTEESEDAMSRARDVVPRHGRNAQAIDAGTGIAVTTICGEPYEPELTDTISDLAFSFSTTNRPFRPELLWLYRNAVNSDTFLDVFPRGTCRMRQARGSQGISSDGSLRFNVSCRVVIRDAAPGSTYERAWWKRVRAEGYYIQRGFVSGQKNQIRATDKDGELVVKPVLHRAFPVSGDNFSLGDQLEDPNEAEFYEFQPPSVVYRPFNTFFQAIVAG